MQLIKFRTTIQSPFSIAAVISEEKRHLKIIDGDTYRFLQRYRLLQLEDLTGDTISKHLIQTEVCPPDLLSRWEGVGTPFPLKHQDTIDRFIIQRALYSYPLISFFREFTYTPFNMVQASIIGNAILKKKTPDEVREEAFLLLFQLLPIPFATSKALLALNDQLKTYVNRALQP